MNAPANKCQITLGANTMLIEREPIANNVPEVIKYGQITGVYPVSYQAKTNVPAVDQVNWRYRFDSMTIIVICLADGNSIPIELQEVTNQATWNLGTQAAQTNAINAINAVL